MCEVLLVLVCFSNCFPLGAGLKCMGENFMLLGDILGVEDWFSVPLIGIVQVVR